MPKKLINNKDFNANMAYVRKLFEGFLLACVAGGFKEFREFRWDISMKTIYYCVNV